MNHTVDRIDSFRLVTRRHAIATPSHAATHICAHCAVAEPGVIGTPLWPGRAWNTAPAHWLA
jgi:hypothetical protein